ncbi:hypothetical protein ABPG74_021203 [Tetrahymena malaccensis]
MDNNQLVQRQFDLQSTFKQQSKSLIIMFHVLTLILFVAAILSVVSSGQLNSDYYFQPIQIMIIISSCAVFLGIAASIFFLFKLNEHSNKLAIAGFLIFLCVTIIYSLAAVSIIVSIPYQYCSYFISHSGYYDGAYIVTSLEISSSYPTCSQINSKSGDQADIILGYAKLVLVKACGSTNSSCLDFSSLKVTSWSNEFGTQLAGCILGGIASFLYLIIVIKMRSRIRTLKSTQASNLALLNAQIQNQPNNQQYYVINSQPPLQYPQNFAQQPQQFQGQYQPINPNYPPVQQNYIPVQQNQNFYQNQQIYQQQPIIQQNPQNY